MPYMRVYQLMPSRPLKLRCLIVSTAHLRVSSHSIPIRLIYLMKRFVNLTLWPASLMAFQIASEPALMVLSRQLKQAISRHGV